MSDRRKCIIHAGTMKTGTTMIQAWLDENSAWLREHGWTYPGYPQRTEQRVQAVVDTLPEGQNLVMSDEGFWHFAGGPRSDTAKIRKILRDFDVTVIVYLRRPDVFLESWFSQGLKHGSGAHSVARFLRQPEVVAGGISRRVRLFTWAWGDERVRFLPYERAQFHDGDLLADFLVKSGLPVPDPLPHVGAGSARMNVTPAADQLLLRGILRQVAGVSEDDIGHVLGDLVPAAEDATRFRIFRPDEIAGIRDTYRPVYRSIQERWGSGADPDFIIDWGEDDHRGVARLRDAFDRLIVEEQA